MNSNPPFDDVFITAHVSGSAGHRGAVFELCVNSALGFYLAYILL